MAPALCESLLGLGRQWLGWSALRRDDLAAASREFGAATPGWSPWVGGLEAFRRGDYAAAATAEQRAIAAWQVARQQDPPPVMVRLAPPVDLGQAYTGLGGAQLLSGNPSAAIATLGQAVKESPANARALFLRARAREIAGQPDAALADLSLASRTAFANAQDLASGEAHLYRGVLLYRRKQLAQAEDEFSSALNFEIPASMRADASAWRRLAAVASGSCAAGRSDLERALQSVSPFFPRQEALQAMAACASASARR
jgi:tetratricopeptide (TPR) repeat protein